MRLVGTIAIEYNDAQISLQRMYTDQRYQAMESTISRELLRIAERKHSDMLVA